MERICKKFGRLKLVSSGNFGFSAPVIGGSKLSEGESSADLGRSTWSSRSCTWSTTIFLLAGALVFGGAAGNWFLSEGPLMFHLLQLAVGSAVMGSTVSVAGSLLFGRNPIRWGVAMPTVVYLGGAFLAVVTGRQDAASLFYSAPLMLGLVFVSGVLSAFLIDGVLPRSEKV